MENQSRDRSDTIVRWLVAVSAVCVAAAALHSSFFRRPNPEPPPPTTPTALFVPSWRDGLAVVTSHQLDPLIFTTLIHPTETLQ